MLLLKTRDEKSVSGAAAASWLIPNTVTTGNNRKQQSPSFCLSWGMSNEGLDWLLAKLLTATQFDVEHQELGSLEKQEQTQGHFSYELKPKKNGFA